VTINVKCDMIFEGGRFGWTETLYRVDATLEDALTAMKLLAFQRMPLLAQGYGLRAVRVSNDQVQRDSLGAEFFQSVQPIAPTPGDLQGTALLCRAESGSLYRRSYFLRGVADNEVTFPDVSPLDAYYLAAFQGFQGALTSQSSRYYIKAIPKPPAGFPKVVAVDLLSNLITTFPEHGYARGDEILIRGTTGIPGLNNRFTVNTVTDTFRFTIFTPPLFGTLTRFTGTTRSAIPGYFPITTFFYQREGHRDTGPGFSQGRGRRRRRKTA
jgi:hypothetical protein